MELEALLMSTAELHCNLYITEVTLRIQTLLLVGGQMLMILTKGTLGLCVNYGLLSLL